MLKTSIPLWILGLLLFMGCTAPASEEATAPEYDFAGTQLPATVTVPDFELIGVEGPVKLSDYRGQYVVVYFGYTFCPDFCPVTLSTMGTVRNKLGDSAERVQVMMITVDPERDTPEILNEYVTYFDPSYIGLTGTVADVETAGEPFGLFFEKGQVAEDESYYLVNHTTRTFLIDPEGYGVLTWSHGTTADQIAGDLQFLIDSENS